MNRFDYVRPTTVAEAVQAIQSAANARFIAGGTNLVDLMKYNVEKPERLVDITRLHLEAIEERDGGLGRVRDVTGHPVAAPHAEAVQRGGDRGDLLGQFRVGRCAGAESARFGVVESWCEGCRRSEAEEPPITGRCFPARPELGRCGPLGVCHEQ